MQNLNNIVFQDKSKLSKTTFTDEGFLHTNAVITRVGVYTYKLADGNTIRVFRSPQELFSDSTMQSMRMIPVTNGHPKDRKLVDAASAKELAVGFLGENLVNDNNENLGAPLKVMDFKAIEDVKGGKNQLSAGYVADLVRENGTYNGQQYDYAQKRIRGNHVAIVKEGRVGNIASIVLDNCDAIQILDTCDAEQILNVDQQPKKDEGKKMTSLKVVMLDGIEYQAAPEVANALNKTQEQLAKLQKQFNDQKTDLAAATAKIDALNKTNYELSSRDINREAAELVKARVELLNTVKASFGDDVASKIKAFDAYEIKCEVLQPLYSDKKLAEQSADYINALFDATVDARKNLSIAKQRETLNFGDKADPVQQRKTSALADFNKRLEG